MKIIVGKKYFTIISRNDKNPKPVNHKGVGDIIHERSDLNVPMLIS